MRAPDHVMSSGNQRIPPHGAPDLVARMLILVAVGEQSPRGSVKEGHW
jgi:hypothetical protein